MYIELFILIIALVFAALFYWAFKNLPKERWQFMFSVPRKKTEDGHWQGMNFTYYGFFTALALIVSVTLFLLMMASIKITLPITAFIITVVLIICLPASSITAALVEKKKYTLSVGGTFFIGILITPWVILAADFVAKKYCGQNIPVLSVMAVMLMAYSIGEGLGRLACISFGCCYGKPLTQCSGLIKNIFKHINFTFTGKTKKISYAHRLDGQQVIPVQALTAVIYTFVGLLGIYLFFRGFVVLPLLLNLIATQIWRIISEFMRADYRGGGKISGYQIMAALAIIYGLLMIYLFRGQENIIPDLFLGLEALWNPFIIIFMIILWAAAFIYTGKSKVTNAEIKFCVIEKNI